MLQRLKHGGMRSLTERKDRTTQFDDRVILESFVSLKHIPIDRSIEGYGDRSLGRTRDLVALSHLKQAKYRRWLLR